MVGMANSDLMANTAPHTHVSCTDEYYQKTSITMDKSGLKTFLTVS